MVDYLGNEKGGRRVDRYWWITGTVIGTIVLFGVRMMWGRFRHKKNLVKLGTETGIVWVVLKAGILSKVIEFPMVATAQHIGELVRRLTRSPYKIVCVRQPKGNDHERTVCLKLKRTRGQNHPLIVVPTEQILNNFTGEQGGTLFSPPPAEFQ